MECLSNRKIASYVEGNLSQVESSMIRDHMLHCERCRSVYEQLVRVEETLSRPTLLDPPPCIERTVMQRLFPSLPSFSAVAALVVSSFLLLISWVYIYFDFADNSLVQAMQITSNRLFRFAGAIIQGISTIFSVVYTGFRAISKLISVLLNVHVDGELVLLTMIIMTSIPVAVFYRFVHKRRRNRSPL